MKNKIAENLGTVERERESYSLFDMEIISKSTHKKFNQQNK